MVVVVSRKTLFMKKIISNRLKTASLLDFILLSTLSGSITIYIIEWIRIGPAGAYMSFTIGLLMASMVSLFAFSWKDDRDYLVSPIFFALGSIQLWCWVIDTSGSLFNFIALNVIAIGVPTVTYFYLVKKKRLLNK